MTRYTGSVQKRLKEIRADKVMEQNFKCHWCGISFTEYRPYTADHIIPHCLGGKVTYDNIVAACDWCNQKRGRETELLLNNDKGKL